MIGCPRGLAESVPENGFTSAAPTAEVELILGFRNLFGIRGFGTDVRAGLFFPGAAYLIENPNAGGQFGKNPDRGVGLTLLFFI